MLIHSVSCLDKTGTPKLLYCTHHTTSQKPLELGSKGLVIHGISKQAAKQLLALKIQKIKLLEGSVREARPVAYKKMCSLKQEKKNPVMKLTLD